MPNELQLRYAPLAATGSNTFDPETRTMRATIATTTEVQRRDERGPFLEVLDPQGFVLPDDGVVPLLAAHRRYGDFADLLGSARNIRASRTGVEADIQLSRRADLDPIATDIADGHIRALSVGYVTLSRREDVDARGVRRITATKWRLDEVSLVLIPADPQARIRSEELPMPDPVVTPPAPAAPAAVPPVLENRARSMPRSERLRRLSVSPVIGVMRRSTPVPRWMLRAPQRSTRCCAAARRRLSPRLVSSSITMTR